MKKIQVWTETEPNQTNLRVKKRAGWPQPEEQEEEEEPESESYPKLESESETRTQGGNCYPGGEKTVGSNSIYELKSLRRQTLTFVVVIFVIFLVKFKG